MSGTWILVRHGESVANAEGWLSGHLDVDLTARGIEQARALSALLTDVAPDRVFSSDLVRARRTAELALAGRGLPLIVTPALRERTIGEWEGMSKAELRASGRMDVLLSWEGRPPGGESQADLARRVLPWLAANDRPGTHLVFAHGGLIRVLVGLVGGTAPEEVGRRVIDNTEIVRLAVGAGRWAELLRSL